MLFASLLFRDHQQDELNKQGSTKHGISLLIPFRNEAKRITPLLSSLLKLSEVEFVDVVFVDDNSTDNSAELVKNYLKQTDISFQVIRNNGIGKKKAICTGLEATKYDYTICLDADVSFNSDFIEQHQNIIGRGFVVGKIMYPFPEGLLQFCVYIESKIQRVFFKPNLYSSKPLLCSGAHYAFSKSMFNELSPFEDNFHIASGDDMFFLDAVRHSNHHIHSTEIAVTTDYPENWKAFYYQRKRWLSKTGYFKKGQYLLSGVMHFLAMYIPVILLFHNPLHSLIYLAVFGLILFLYLVKEEPEKHFRLLLVLPVFYLIQFVLPIILVFSLPKHDQKTWR